MLIHISLRFLSAPSPSIALCCQSVLLLNFAQIVGYVKVEYMDFSNLLHGLVKIDTWISLSCYMDLSKTMPGFRLVVIWICQSSCTHLSKCNKLLKQTEPKFDQYFYIYNLCIVRNVCVMFLVLRLFDFSNC